MDIVDLRPSPHPKFHVNPIHVAFDPPTPASCMHGKLAVGCLHRAPKTPTPTHNVQTTALCAEQCVPRVIQLTTVAHTLSGPSRPLARPLVVAPVPNVVLARK